MSTFGEQSRRIPLNRGSGGSFLKKRVAICSAELDIDIAELDKANHQQHNAYAGHAQDIAPVQDAENRVAIQMEDRDVPNPGRDGDQPFERFLQVGQSEVRGHNAQHSPVAQASGQGIDQAYGNQRQREHAEAGAEHPTLVDVQVDDLCSDDQHEPGQHGSQQDHQDIRAEAFQQDP